MAIDYTEVDKIVYHIKLVYHITIFGSITLTIVYHITLIYHITLVYNFPLVDPTSPTESAQIPLVECIQRRGPDAHIRMRPMPSIYNGTERCSYAGLGPAAQRHSTSVCRRRRAGASVTAAVTPFP